MSDEMQKPYDNFYKEGLSFYNCGIVLRESSQRLSDEDYYFSPIIFLFRHAVELFLKSLIIRAILISNISEWAEYRLPPINKKITSIHSLLSLYESWEVIDRTKYSANIKENIEYFKSILKRLDEFDYSSSFFRYPYSRDGIRNPKHLSEEMDEYILSSMPCSLGALVHGKGVENFSCLHRENGLDDFEFDLVDLNIFLIKCYNVTNTE